MKIMQWIHREIKFFHEWTVIREMGYKVGYLETRKAMIERDNQPKMR